ncbi:MAG: FecR family protein [Pseudomonadota bacterium]
MRAAAFLLTWLLAFSATAQDRVGKVTRAQPDAFQRVETIGHALNHASAIYRDALVYTRRFGSAQIRLNDGTDLLISPKSSILIDDFVFAGDDAAGGLGMTLVSGALRVLSGRMAKPSYTVNTVVAQIGVRGTLFWLDVDEPGILKIWVDEGAVEARPVGTTETFLFTAPIYAECTPTTCYEAPAPPAPAKFPDDPTRR